MSVPPLRMRRADGSLYDRPVMIERKLESLVSLPAEEVVRRSRITDPNDPAHLPSESLLHLIRPRGSHEINPAIRDLFSALRQRVLRAVPVSLRRLPGTTKVTEKSSELEVQETVMHKFLELLCGDRDEYKERLDFYTSMRNDSISTNVVSIKP